jgi:shikimate dehydrogenase
VTERVGLIGDPVALSLSPRIQAAALEATGLDWEYQLVSVGRGQLASRWDELRSRFLGLNVTIPIKEEAARLATRLSTGANRCGSVNTLTFTASEAIGDSTDGPGFMAALAGGGLATPQHAVVLGTGGSARAVVAALAEQGVEVEVLGRNAAVGGRLAQDLSRSGLGGVRFSELDPERLTAALAGADLLANATPVGGAATPLESLVPESVRLDRDLVVFDLVYSPRQTPLLRRAAGLGCRVVEGVEMLVEQGALSFECWTGRRAPVGEMRQAAYLALAELDAVAT